MSNPGPSKRPSVGETPEEKRQRLDRRKAQRREKIAAETAEEALARKQKKAAYQKEYKARQAEIPETAEQAQARKEAHAANQKNYEARQAEIPETAEQSQARKEAHAANQRNYEARQAEIPETPEQAQARKEAHAANQRNYEARRKKAEAERQNKILCHTNLEKWKQNENAVEQHSCGNMDIKCKGCGSLNFKDEMCSDRSGFVSRCCKKGKVQLEPLTEYPEQLKKLLTMGDPYSKIFRERIRSINSSFAFASMGANMKPPNGNGPYCFRVHGQIYHRTGTLHPAHGETRQFAQLYVLDPNEATDERMKHPGNSDCPRDLMETIARVMHGVNLFAQAYRMLQEVEREAMSDNTDSVITMAIKNDRNSDPRRYNEPRVSEVAVVFDNIDGEPPFERDLLIYPKFNPDQPGQPKIKRISILDPNLDAMIYPILFPNGDQSWGIDIPRLGGGARHRVSQMEYYGYRFSVREEFSPLLHAGRLTQQLATDWYVKMEGNRLNFIKMNQPKLRVESYKGFIDYMAGETEDVPGKPVILPSSFEGSPRNMQQRYHDAMSIVTKYGKPDLFITMTCNPNWDEIKNNLMPFEKTEDRPDLVPRVFHIKMNALLEDFKKLFGTQVAKFHVVEFQKRGLPHAHILLILDKNYKLETEADIDRIVSAEIPDEAYPELRKRVISHMVHGPCGARNKDSPCMDKGKCSKEYPKSCLETTLGNINGYPLYRRRSGKSAIKNKEYIDNTWIVPHNPYLILKYNCHINVEVCASIRSVKYLFKYVYKGHDCANVEIKEKQVDETKKFVDARYVSAPEALWRIFAFKMHDQSHVVQRLAVHVPQEHTVCFNVEDMEEDPDKVAEKVARKDSTLTAWFKLNAEDADARQYNYWEIPQHYTFGGKWKKRQKGTAIGRMYVVSVSDTERYYLRLLLIHVKGAKSFSELLTVDGIQYESFRDAARKRGLLIDDTVWQQTIEDAIVFSMPNQLRQLYAYICVYCSPTDPESLWQSNKEHFTEDICRRHGNDECNNCEAIALNDVLEVFLVLKFKYQNIKLPFPAPGSCNTRVQFDADEELEQYASMYMDICNNPQQKYAFDEIMAAVNGHPETPKCFFLDGPGGSGKTFLYRTLMHCLRGDHKIVLPTATTGIAANLLLGGRTMHSQFGVPLELNEGSVSTIKPTSVEARIIANATLLLLDECTMASCHALNLIDNFLRDVMSINFKNENLKHVPFGGKAIVLGGDFRQCLAIFPHAMQAAIVQGCLKYSKSWSSFRHLTLVSNMRSEDPEYSRWLLQVGNGTITNDDALGDEVMEVPPQYVCESNLVTDIFGEDLENVDSRSLSARAILCPLNNDVDKVNTEVISKLPGELQIYHSTDEAECTNPADTINYPVEFLNSLCESGMPSHVLKLKVNTIVILLRNLNTKRGLCNGTRLIVKQLEPNVIVAEVITGSAIGDVVLIPRIICTTQSGSDIPFTLRRRQFPVKPAFAMTINKAQGQTLDKVGVLLPNPVFAHGQLYVAFSRVRRASDLKIKIFDCPTQGKLVKDSDKIFTRNVVYREVLQN